MNSSDILTLTVCKNLQEPWGFRLQGGSDFSTPLSIQSVNAGSAAERCGLRAGDAVLRLNGRPSDEIEHEEAKRMILMAGTQVDIMVQRGAVHIWKPQVTPMSQLRPAGQPSLQSTSGEPGDDDLVQRTSLAANKQDSSPVGSGFNRTARPFPGFGVTTQQSQAASVRPSTFQSIDSPANTAYASQAPYAPPSPAPTSFVQACSTSGREEGEASHPSGFRSVRAPILTQNASAATQQQHATCKVCGRLIVGVFVRIKGEPMHPECFKCAGCGKNLKNQGHFTVNDQLYCESCAQQTGQMNTTVYATRPIYN